MTTMNALFFFLLIVSWVLAAHASPWRNYQVHSQACGDKLADLMLLVCSGRGYNVAFPQAETRPNRRVRRGIVEECCRRSCSPALLELYCQAETPETPSNNVQIKKRSDSAVESTEQYQTQDDTEPSTAHSTQRTTTQETKKVTNNDITTVSTTPKPQVNYKTLNLLTSSEHKYNHNKNSLNKDTPNETAEQKYFPDNIPRLRHRNHHHRPNHRHRASTKTKRDKNMRAGSTQTFQIGVVKPYFAGRAFASYRSTYPVLSS